MENVLRDMNPVIQMLVVMTVFSLLPFVFSCMTSFLRFVIVFSMINTALGTQQVQPSIVIIGLSMILTFYTMGPVFQKMYDYGSIPYKKSGDIVLAITEGSKPLKEFMMKQTRESDLEFFVSLSQKEPPKSPEDITIWQVAPDRKSTRLNSSHQIISYAVFCLKK